MNNSGGLIDVLKAVGRKVVPIRRLRKIYLRLFSGTIPVVSIPIACSVDGDLAAELLITTKTGLIHYKNGQARRLCPGRSYGITYWDNRWWISRTMPDETTCVFSFQLNEGGITGLRKELVRLNKEIHQVDAYGSWFYIADTYANRLLRFRKVRDRLVQDKEVFPEGRLDRGRESSNYLHLNSVFRNSRHVYLMCHNDTIKTGRKSKILVMDEELNVIKTIDSDSSCAHNVALLDGQIIYCDSIGQSLVWGGDRVKLDKFTRGLAMSKDVIYVGSSDFGPREKRESSHGKVFAISSNRRVAGTLSLPNVGGIYEVRLVGQPDLAMSDTRNARCDKPVLQADAGIVIGFASK